ncbi:MAG: hypothetical protein AAFY76_04625 [Cyanobacteria bacterium J06649_11]
MKKLKLFLKLNLFLLILTFYTSTKVIKANAGEVNAQGSTLESTGYSGSNFNPQNQRINTQLTNVTNSIQINNGQITVPQDIQQKINQAASNILNEIDSVIATELNSNRDKTTITSDSNGSDSFDINSSDSFDINSNEVYSADIISILTEEASINEVTLPIRNIFVEAGVSLEAAEELINSMQGMIKVPISVSAIDTSNFFQTTQTLANNKSLDPDILLAQNKQINVDVNKLNAAINAFNKIIMKSDAETLNKLALNPKFINIRNILNRFRTALSNPGRK